jgi:hypothetical protein
MKTIPRKVIYLAAALMLAASLALLPLNAPQGAAHTQTGQITTAAPHEDFSTSARNNAAFILNQRNSIDVLEVDVWQLSQKFGSIIADAINENFEATVIDREAFIREFFGDLPQVLSKEMHASSIDIYLQTFSERELSDMAEFHKLNGTREIYIRGIPLWFKTQIISMREKHNFITAVEARRSTYDKIIAEHIADFSNLAAIIEREDIVHVDDPEYRAELVKSFRVISEGMEARMQ